MRALAGAGAFMHRGQNRGRGIDPGEQVGHRHADAMRLALGRASDRHQPGHALDDVVVSGAVRIRPILPEAGDRTIDQPREIGLQAGVIQPVFPEATDLEVLDHHIGAGQQGADLGLPLGRGEIRRDRSLAPVRRVEIGGDRPALAVDEGRAPAARVIALRSLDLDHLGAQIGQGLAGPGPGQDPRQFDNLQAGQRFGGHYRPRSGSRIAWNSAKLMLE